MFTWGREKDIARNREAGTVSGKTPELVGLCFGTGHYVFGGDESIDGVTNTQPIWHVHFEDHEPNVAIQARKDEMDCFTSVRNDIFCEFGKGNVDFTAVVKELKKTGYDH